MTNRMTGALAVLSMLFTLAVVAGCESLPNVKVTVNSYPDYYTMKRAREEREREKFYDRYEGAPALVRFMWDEWTDRSICKPWSKYTEWGQDLTGDPGTIGKVCVVDGREYAFVYPYRSPFYHGGLRCSLRPDRYQPKTLEHSIYRCYEEEQRRPLKGWPRHVPW